MVSAEGVTAADEKPAQTEGECPISDKDVQRIADYLRKSEGERRREARSAKQ